MTPAYRDEPMEWTDIASGLLWYATRGLLALALAYGLALLFLV